MPVMDGAKAFDKLEELNPEVKVLVMSGYQRDARIEVLLKTGAVGFLHKPFTFQMLREAIEAILPRDA